MQDNNSKPTHQSRLAALLPMAAAVALASMSPLQAAAETLEERVARLEAALAEEKEAKQSATDYSFGGYIKLDIITSDYSGGDRATAGVGDDFFVPSTIPIGGDSGDVYTDVHAKHSRIWFKTSTQTDAGTISTHLEMDFGVNQAGDERISNSAANRLRHAFIKWQYDENSSLLAGQSWSTFFNVGTLPDIIDFVGPVGTIFERQPQLRWTHGLAGGNSFMVALENPSTGLYGQAGSSAGGSNFDNNAMPDVVLRYNGSAGDLSYSASVVAREIAYKQTFTDSNSATVAGDESTIGYGLALAGTWKLGQDDIRFQFNAGNALGRYMGLQSYRDGVIEDNGDIELIDQVGGYIAYRHPWSPQWRSSLVLSASSADNPDTVAATTPKSYQSLHANLLYSPVAALTLGAELIHGEKTIEGDVNGDDSGELDRLQFSVKYVF